MHGLRTRLAQLVLAATLPLLTLIGYDNLQRWRGEAADADAQAMRAAVGLAADTGRRLASANGLLAHLARQPDVRALDAARCHPVFAEQPGLFPEFTNLVLVRRDGSPVCSALARPTSATPLVNRALYLDPTLRNNAFTVGQMSRGVFTGRQVVLVGFPVGAADGAGLPAGVIAAAVDLSQLPMAKGLASLPSRAQARLIDANKRVMADSDTGPLGVGASVAAVPWLQALRAGVAANGSARDGDGTERIYAAAPVPGADWHAVVAIPSESVFGPLRRRAGWSAAVAVGALALSGLLAWALGRRTVRPVEAIAAAARRAAAPGAQAHLGELGELAPARLHSAPSELRSLAADFCAMLAARDAAEQALRDSEQNLAITLQSIGDAVITTDPGGRITGMNPTAELLTGWPRADALGQPLAQVFRIVDARTREPLADPVQRVLALGDTVGLANGAALLARDGSERQVADSAAPIRHAGGPISGVVLVFSDVSERYAAERALLDSELRLKIVIDHLHDGLILWPEGEPAQWNRAAVAMGGFARADECPRDFATFRQMFEVFAVDGAPLPVEAWPMARLLRGAPVNELEMVLARRGGEWRRVLRCNGMRVTGPDGRLLLFLSIIDVTEARQAAIAQQRSLERLRATGELAQVGGWELDVASGHIELSDELRQIVGLPPEYDVTTANALDFYAPEARAAIDAATRAVIVDGTPWDMEAAVVFGGAGAAGGAGTRRWVRTSARAVREQGRTLRVIGAIQDVTDLHDTQERAREGETLLMLASRLVRVGGWEVDLSTGLVTWSDEIADIHGVPRGKPLPLVDGVQFYQGESRARVAAAFEACARDGTPYDLELALRNAEDREAWVRAIGQPVRDADGRIVRVRGAILDITERKQAERALAHQQQNLEALVRERTAELASARDAAERANRAKSNFLANMSHEIRTPLNAIIGLTHLLREDVTDPQARGRLSKVNAAAHHLLGVINDILDLSKIESGRATLDVHDFAVGDVISHTLDMVRQRAQDKGLKLAFALDPALPLRLRGDAMRIEQVLVNFLSNAVKFSERGTVTLRLRHWPAAAGIGEGAIGLRVEVQDEGVGLTAEQRERLFKPFSQADESTARRYGGTGLGLAIVTRLAAMMGGDTGVDSTPGVGSTFWITAQVQAAAGDAVAAGGDDDGSIASPEAALRSRFPGARVLLADDDPVNQMVIEELLRRLGLNVDVVDGGEQAIHRVHDHDYALVLMDMQMPVIDGLAATRAIRELPHRRTLPIVALTANAFAEDRERCLAAGMNDHLSKPVEPHTFAACLLRWLMQAQQRRQEEAAQAKV